MAYAPRPVTFTGSQALDNGQYKAEPQLLVGQLPVDSTAGSSAPVRNGLIGWSFDSAAAVSSTAATAGVIILAKIWAEKTGNVSNIHVGVANTPATAANTYVGLYNASGTRIGVSTDLSTQMNSTTPSVFIGALTAPAPVVANSPYWAAFLIGSGGTLPTLARATTLPGVGSDGSVITMTFGTGLTSLPTSINFGSASTSTTAFYASIA